ncbi:aldehyde dehydrogenase family protein [Serratia proteamaculans]|jgi:betaine-aldehyde dehydrogenase|uniref:aldehyde dehydrogenase family protein n=1 Tax=Serratia proteamaculans TaxID=28151 RepID=UPI0039AEC465
MQTGDQTLSARPKALHWIDGQWQDSAKQGISISPADGSELGEFADGGAEEAAMAIAAAQRAFVPAWSRDRHLRARCLNQMADRFEQHAETLAQILAQDNGKPLNEARFEVKFIPSKLRYAAALALTTYGRAMEIEPGALSRVLYEPLGVVGVITPWNSPAILTIRSLAPALAAGNTAVIKLPAQTAQVNTAFARILAEVDSLPQGVVNLFTESGSDGAMLLVSSPAVPAISFTGSTRTGRSLAANAMQRIKRISLELGGKTPHLLFEDADLDRALPMIVRSLTTFSGQFCVTGSRLLVQRAIYPQVRARMAALLEAVKIGPSLEPGVELGPLIDRQSVQRVDAMVTAALAQGATAVVRGGPVVDGPLAKGAFYRPTLLEVPNSDMDIVQQEVFGPVLTLEVFDDEAQAIVSANHSDYGLAASIWSMDANRPHRVAREIQAGSVWINDWAQIHDEFEEGGYKQSGLGRLNGIASLDSFIEYKHVYQNVGVTDPQRKD